MTKRIIYSTEGGGVAVVIPAPKSGLTVEQIAAKDVPEGVAFEIVDAADVPTDRTFRNAWERKGRAIGHNMIKARELAHEKRREARAAEFAPLDVEATIPALAAKAEAKRQAVREKYDAVQKDIDKAADVGALKRALGLA